MIAGLRPYPEYKDSGVEWLGEVPAGWEVRRLKRAFSRIVGGATPKSDNDAYWDGDIRWATPVDVTTTAHIHETVRTLTGAGLSACSAELVPAGSVGDVSSACR